VSCAAALATLKCLQGGLIDNAGKTGAYLIEKLRALQRRHRHIGDVRGLGLMVGVEIVKDPATREPAPEMRHAMIVKAFERGLLMLPCGASTIRLSPPLICSPGDVDKAVAILDATLADVGR
jgi:4-aminobutyrate aminotransferase